MSFASRLWPCLPLLAAVIMTPAGNAATACPDLGGAAVKRVLGPAASTRVLALGRGGCPLECTRHEADGQKAPEHEAHAPLPLSIVTRAEDVADWHADIFERLRGEQFEDGMVRYCGIARSTPGRPL